MNRVLPHRCSPARHKRGGAPFASRWLWLVVCCGFASPALAERPAHYLLHANLPPGAIGSWQLLRGGPHAGYFQPVEINAPQGALVSLAEQGHLEKLQPTPRLAGMLIGAVYRLRVANIPNRLGAEVFPTIEVIDRLYPPENQAARFPIVIELTAEDLQLAADGKYVTRVVYLEDPDNALPVRQEEQGWFDAVAGEDPLRVADELGRPVAVVRMGGRVPADPADPGMEFLYGAPPWQRYTPKAAPAPAAEPVEGARLPPAAGQRGRATPASARREYYDAPTRTTREQELIRR
ncbi:MAG: hypothetical protein AB7O62_06540 [Pirellulales bacterium]